jgi:hypothetical protein
MSRERLGRIALGLYPADVRAERGAELLGTLLDAGDDSRTAFFGQLWSVIVAGLAARLRESQAQPAKELATDSLAWAAITTAFTGLVALAAALLHFGGTTEFPGGLPAALGLPALALVLFTVWRTRLSGLFGLAWMVLKLAALLDRGRLPHAYFIQLALPLVGFGLLALLPRSPVRRSRWIWLAPAIVFAFSEFTWTGMQSGSNYIAPLIVGLCFLPFAPSFALGTALAWSVLGLVEVTVPYGSGKWTVLSIELVGAVPLAIIATSVGRLLLRRGSPKTRPDR